MAEGVTDALEDLDEPPAIGLIVTAMRSHPPGANVELARHAGAFGHPVVGFDLAGPEAAYPAPPHAAAFRAAQAAGLGLTAHAGETADTKRIWEVLEFGVSRVAHGAPAVDRSTVDGRAADRDVTLDLCPTSNVQTGVVADLASHPVTELHRSGVSVTVSTDDRTVSDTTLSGELAAVAVATGMTGDELAEIAINAFRRGFSSPLALASRRADAARAWHAWAETARAAQRLIRPSTIAQTSAGPAATWSGARSGGASAAPEALVTPVRTTMLSIPARRAPRMSESRLSPTTIASPAVGAGLLEDGLEHGRLGLADDEWADAGRRLHGVDHGPGAGPEPVGRGVARIGVGGHEPGAGSDRRRGRGQARLVEVEVHAHQDRIDARRRRPPGPRRQRDGPRIRPRAAPRPCRWRPPS